MKLQDRRFFRFWVWLASVHCRWVDSFLLLFSLTSLRCPFSNSQGPFFRCVHIIRFITLTVVVDLRSPYFLLLHHSDLFFLVCLGFVEKIQLLFDLWKLLVRILTPSVWGNGNVENVAVKTFYWDGFRLEPAFCFRDLTLCWITTIVFSNCPNHPRVG